VGYAFLTYSKNKIKIPKEKPTLSLGTLLNSCHKLSRDNLQEEQLGVGEKK